jgi:hypothetical protein
VESVIARLRLKQVGILILKLQEHSPPHQGEPHIQHRIEQRPFWARHIVDKNAR